MRRIFFLLFLLFNFFFLENTFAQSFPNNKFGIHLAEPSDHDLEAAAKLVNSSGGDWGYVTLVIREDDRDINKWQEIFNKLRRLHLIPIIRLATKVEQGVWRRPSIEDIPSWVNFLDSLNWVIKNRYVILFNEPNHAAEWGGAVDPENYAEVAFHFAKALKEKNPDFFVMLAGLDASSPSNPPYFEDEEIFLRRMLARSRQLSYHNNSQEDSNQSKRKSNDHIGINCPKVSISHKLSSSNLYPRNKKNVPNNTSIVNTRNSDKVCNPEKLGTIKTAANQAAERLTTNAERVLNSAFFLFFKNNLFIKNILAKEIVSEPRDLFDFIDGWASHSYPKDYLGSPYDTGRGSIRTYQWELALLRSLGVAKELPVFITETGWKRQIQNSKFKFQKYLDSETVGRYFQIAFENVWGPDERVFAVTPFILNYQQEPFLEFSWRMINEGDFYPQYYMVQNIPKTKGEPPQKYKITVQTRLPTELIENSLYRFQLVVENQGQAILDKNEGHRIIIKTDDQNDFPFENYFFSDFLSLEPYRSQMIDFHLKTKEKLADFRIKFLLFKNEQPVAELFSWQFKVSPWPSLDFKVRLSPKLKTFGNDFEIQIFDKNEQLVYKKKNIEVKNGKGRVERIGNVVFGERYRVVILKPYYLPRQNFIVFKKNENKINFPPMLPFDLNLDGRFSLFDLLIFVKKPSLLFLHF